MRTMHTDGINLSCLNNLKSTVPVILIVRRSRQCRPNSGVDIGIVPQQALHGRMVKVRAVIDRSNFTRGTSENLRFP